MSNRPALNCFGKDRYLERFVETFSVNLDQQKPTPTVAFTVEKTDLRFELSDLENPQICDLKSDH